jgi:hypothetical protein
LVAGGIDIAAASKFFGARGGAGAGIGVASELLRKYFTEKQFGYTAGAGQGMAGAMLAGAAFGGPIGSAISGGIYGVTEGMQMRAETNSAIADSRILGAAGLFDMARDIGGTNEGSARSKSQEIMRRLMNRKGELENMRQYDQDEFSGYSGTMMSLFGVSKRQFGQSESRELAKVTEQRERLGKAVNSGDTREMIRVLQEIQNELAKQARSNAEPEGKKPEQAQVNSSIAVDISVKDLDRIPSAINDNIIGPLVEQLAQLQQTVNELVNRQSPQPAQVR